MKTWAAGTASYLAHGVIISLTTASFAAGTHIVVGTQRITWTFNGMSSAANRPLVIDTLKKGDVVEIQIPAGPIPHGFVTTKIVDGRVTEIRDVVVACGEDPKSKPNAVMREIDCGAAPKFGQNRFTGSMRLEVLETFGPDTDFYCTIHKTGMAGTLKLKP